MVDDAFRNRSRRGFSFIELMIVIAIIVALAGVSIPILSAIKNRGKRAATDTVVQAVATAIIAHQAKSWTVYDQSTQESTVHRLWDINQDYLIDGDPALENPDLPAGRQFSQAVIDSDYKGLVLMTEPTLPKGFVNRKKQPVDAWKQPLRIAYAITIYGPQGLGVWSAGPDGVDDAYDALHDDLRSWEKNSE